MSDRRRTASRTTAALLVAFGAFQAGLAAGLPWGRAAYFGERAGRLPRTHRRVSGVAALVYASAAALVGAQAGGDPLRRRVLSGLTGFMALGTAVNLASRSPVERLWAPLCAITALVAWRARPGDREA